MMRVFFTGAFRRPRRSNWVLGVVLLLAGIVEGFTGHSLLAVIGAHLAVVWFQRHTQFPGPGRTERNVVGSRLPTFAVRSGGLMVLVVGVLALMGGLLQINPIFHYGPYNPVHVSAGSTPELPMAVFDGAVRLWPSWELYLFGRYTVPSIFFPAVIGIGVLITLLLVYPFVERRLTGDGRLVPAGPGRRARRGASDPDRLEPPSRAVRPVVPRYVRGLPRVTPCA